MTRAARRARDMRGAVWNALGSAMYAAVSFCLLAMVSRYSGDAETAGAFSIAFTTAQMLYLVGVFGVSHFQMTDYAGEYGFVSYALAKLATTLALMIAAAAAVALMGFTGDKAVWTLLLALFMLVSSLSELFQSAFFRVDRLDLSGQSLFLRNFFSVAAFAAACLARRGITRAICAACLANALATIAVCARMARACPAAVRVGARRAPWRECGEILRKCLPIFAATMLVNLMVNAPKYALEFLGGDGALGYFSMIFILVYAVNLAAEFIFRPALHLYARRYFAGDLESYRALLRRHAGLTLALTGLGCAAAWLAGPQVLEWIYGVRVEHLRGQLTLVILGGGMVAFDTLMYNLYVMARRQGTLLGVYAAGAAICFALSAFAVRRGGLAGAVTAFLISYAVLTALLLARLPGRGGRSA